MIKNVLIVEDEPQAAQRLQSLIEAAIPDIVISAKIDSIEKSVKWIAEHDAPDLIFMDIQLADGLSFRIFEQCDVRSPVIFTTAYDAYALKAFAVNSIDYILKPVDRDDLARALNKFRMLTAGKSTSQKMMESIAEAVKMLTQKYKTRFMLKVGEHLRAIEVTDILFFYSLEKATFAQTQDGRRHVIDFTMDQLVEVLDPSLFFRINRKYIISTGAIRDMVSYTNSRLRLSLKGVEDSDIVVARERVQQFKDWLDR